MMADDLCSRAHSLEVVVGDVSNNGLGIKDGVEQLRRDLRAIMDKHGGSIDKINQYLVSYSSPQEIELVLGGIDEDLTVWFETHHEEIKGIIEDLVSLDATIGGQMESIFEPFVDRMPNAIIELSCLHDVTNRVIQLVLKSYALLRRFVSLSIEEENLLLEIQTRINHINGALQELEAEQIL